MRSVVKPMLSKAGSRYALGVWGAKLVDKVVQLTHIQWIPRNTEIHFKLPDGWTLVQHEEILMMH